jgi:type 1 glutamine amidotransferase
MRSRIAIASVLILATSTTSLLAQQTTLPDDALAKIKAALPDKPSAKPQKPRRLLVFTLCRGFRHSVIPLSVQAFKLLGEKTGAFETVESDDSAMFEPDQLAPFDAVCLMNSTGDLFLPPDFEKLSPAERAAAEKRDAHLKQSFLDFVKSGKGLIGVHAATDCFYKWTEYGEMLGAYFDGHPWNEEVGIKLDDPRHPLNAAFEGQPFSIADEIYQFKEPYSRQHLHVLLSLDTARTNVKKDGIKRTDGDFAVSWVREYGKGRVFYCSLGHRDDIFWNPKVLRHYLAGIQYALGDLPADAKPVPPQPGTEAQPAPKP